MPDNPGAQATLYEEPTWLSHLNPAQREAVTLPMDSHGAILAGAGTGKTNVLTHRMAYAIRGGMEPNAIVAVTFTNKAAKEIKERIARLVGEEAAGKIRLGTFHSLGLKFLRKFGHHIGLERCETAAPMDEDEAVALLRRVMKDRFPDTDLKVEKPKDHYFVISQWKEQGLYVNDVPVQKTASANFTRILYAAYEAEKKRSQALDFADLVLQSNFVLRHHPEVAAVFHQHLRMVLVDEFQDTNPIQVEFIGHLTGTGHSVPTFVVGDDDQSIYGWRGADAGIMQSFLQTYTPNHLVRLEQNYRCTSTILDAANAVIANNPNRIGKRLWTERQDVGSFQLDIFADAEAEAGAIADRIRNLLADGVPPADIVVLYRKNMLSRGIEKALVFRDIPYRIYGGLNFFQRREIKDALAWLRLVQNPLDEMALFRAIAAPRRGVGTKTIEQWKSTAQKQGVALWDVLQVDKKASIQSFVQIVHRLRQIYEAEGLVVLVKKMLALTKLEQYYITAAKERGEECAENLQELVIAAGVFHHEMRATGLHMESLARTPGDMLSEFLADAVLNSDQGGQKKKEGETVSLMTVHKAKGLEFPYVFLLGLEDGEFPKITQSGFCNLEEERRLFYVAVTRSKFSLFLSCVRNRQSFGYTLDAGDDEAEDGLDSHFVSRFVQEIPAHLLGDAARLVQASSRKLVGSETGSDGDWW
ncbi:ATP-dependent helicase [Acidithiobacillus thiooxidans]|uniref:DNA 3'-5' helicase n=1 Tax=Acidithiobacillus thiooxidans ATCC 19377 TaxID=637390 RepID=A0A543Q1U1_ACITH|nr:UvrD-helicase domain-containing protein [Acidithiobacillus thiooxidans]MDX5935549.1 3'-5' exonuclease [Acidithiobacillus thiooxidans]TQN50309.1 DNA helicase II [Acidithiobacillus thiooxidans ATCC 19377]